MHSVVCRHAILARLVVSEWLRCMIARVRSASLFLVTAKNTAHPRHTDITAHLQHTETIAHPEHRKEQIAGTLAS